MDPEQPHPLHPHVVLPVRRDRTGREGPTRNQAAGPRYRRTSHGLYVPSEVDGDDVDQRIAEAAVLLPDYGGLTGWSALYWSGASWFDGTFRNGDPRAVELAVMHGEIRSQPGIRVTSERLPPRDLTEFDRFSITSHVRSVCFEMRYAESDRAAVVILDMAAMFDLVSIDEVAAYVALLNGWTGVGRCRVALVLADENSWSAMETVMRLIWVIDVGYPPPMCNRPVFDLQGRHIGTPDLIDIEAGVVGQYNGKLHLEGGRNAKDLQTEAAYRRVGLECFTMVASDQRSPETTIIPRMEEARHRARFEAESSRGWTINPPRWWTLTTTVAARRALSARQRGRLLRYRAG